MSWLYPVLFLMLLLTLGCILEWLSRYTERHRR